MSRRPGAVAAVVLLLGAGPAFTQSPREEFDDELLVSEVLLDAVVTDGRGSVILGLGPDDFVVEEEGVAVELESVEFYSNRTLRGVEVASPELPRERWFVLLFYRPPLSSRTDPRHYLHLPEAGNRAYQWIVEDLGPTDWVAVLAWDGRLRLAHDFTRDRERLGWALREVTTGELPERPWPSRFEEAPPRLSIASLLDSPRVEEASGEIFPALEILGEALGKVPGRKVLINFGVSYPVRDDRGRRRAWREMVEALNANNVAAYGVEIDGAGRRHTPGELAETTGATYEVAFRDALEPLRRIGRENSGYYLLSYRSRHPAGSGGYREVAVRTVNPEFRVRARSGYRPG